MYIHDYNGGYDGVPTHTHAARKYNIIIMYTYGPQYLRNQCNTTIQ